MRPQAGVQDIMQVLGPLKHAPVPGLMPQAGQGRGAGAAQAEEILRLLAQPKLQVGVRRGR